MQAMSQRDTKPELAVRRALHRLGLRYWVDRRPLPELRRTGDAVFPRARLVVFVDGCFWHGCALHCAWPKQNASWWREKIEANQRRDRDTDNRLIAAGWLPVRVWEHEHPDEAAAAIKRLVQARLSGRGAAIGPPLTDA